MDNYSSRAQLPRRKAIPPATRRQVLERDDFTCAYCGFDAETVDHVVPYSYGGSDELDNLVACCSICNSILSDRIFESVSLKREFIRKRYGPFLVKRVRRHRRPLSICADCGHIYAPTERHATNVLCAQCKIDDDTWEADDPRRRAKRLAKDAHAAHEHDLLTSFGEHLAVLANENHD